MAKRSEFSDVVIDLEGNALDGISVSVVHVGTSNEATLYTTRTGGGTKTNPFETTSNGLVEFYADPGTYEITFTDTELTPRISERTIVWEAVSGDDQGIDIMQLPEGAEGEILTTASGVPDYQSPIEAIGTSLAQKLGISNASGVRRGKRIINDEHVRTNTSYGLLTTPDQVENVVLPTDGLIVIAYQALFKSSVQGAGEAAIFIGSNQLKGRQPNTADPTVDSAETVTNATDRFCALSTSGEGLVSDNASVSHGGEISTGQVISADPGEGGPCYVFASAGTYTVSVQFRATSGSVTVRERKLFVWTMAF